MEIQGLRDELAGAQRRELHCLIRTMFVQLPLFALLATLVVAGTLSGVVGILLLVPIEILLFRQLGKAGDELARVSGLLSAAALESAIGAGPSD